MDHDLDEHYRAPRAGYQGKGHIVYEEISVLSLTQRLNRLRFACYSLTAWLITALVTALLMILATAAISPQGQANQGLLLLLLVLAIVLPAMVYFLGLMVRRLHDLDRSGWWLTVYFLPMIAVPVTLFVNPGAQTLIFLMTLVQPLFLLYLMAGAGTPGMNRFGTPNPANGLLVKLFGGLWWLLVVLATLLNVAVLVFSSLAPDMLPTGSGMQDMEAFQRQLDELRRQLP